MDLLVAAHGDATGYEFAHAKTHGFYERHAEGGHLSFAMFMTSPEDKPWRETVQRQASRCSCTLIYIPGTVARWCPLS